MARQVSSNKFENGISAAFRALSKDKNATVTFDNLSNKATLNKNIISLPKLKQTPSRSKKMNIRGEADSKALCLNYHDKNIHNNFAYAEEIKQQIFNDAGRTRYESIGSNNMLGIKKNISTLLLKINFNKLCFLLSFCLNLEISC